METTNQETVSGQREQSKTSTAVGGGTRLGLTLYDLEKRLVELMDLYSDEELEPDHREKVAEEIQLYVRAEIRKVDNVRSYLRHCEQMVAAAREEQARQKQHADAWQARYDRLKEVCKYVMQTFHAKRFDGNTGSLLLKVNGGKLPVIITDESLIPEEFCEYTIKRVAGPVFLRIVKECSLQYALADVIREPRKGLIEAELQKPCEACEGKGFTNVDGSPNNAFKGSDLDTVLLCQACRGSGKRGVPGARLEPRGEHLEVK